MITEFLTLREEGDVSPSTPTRGMITEFLTLREEEIVNLFRRLPESDQAKLTTLAWKLFDERAAARQAKERPLPMDAKIIVLPRRPRA